MRKRQHIEIFFCIHHFVNTADCTYVIVDVIYLMHYSITIIINYYCYPFARTVGLMKLFQTVLGHVYLLNLGKVIPFVEIPYFEALKTYQLIVEGFNNASKYQGHLYIKQGNKFTSLATKRCQRSEIIGKCIMSRL